jgi:predicted alpha/beta-hydrolase family hydrolase
VDQAKAITVETDRGPVGALWAWPPGARAAVVVAHGAGGDMTGGLLEGFSACLYEATFGTLRFNFPYAEQGRKSPDAAGVLIRAYRAAFELTRTLAQEKPVFVGGKSLGGRMASMAVAEGLRADGLVFLGYPLHPPGKPDRLRDEHLYGIREPMLFLQGTEDPFARFDLIEQLVERLGRWAVLHPVEGGDHSFRVKGRRRDDVETGRLLGSVAARFIQGARI